MPDDSSDKSQYLQDLEQEIARTKALKNEVEESRRQAGPNPHGNEKAHLADKERELQQSQESVNEKTRIAIEKGHVDVSTPKNGTVFYDNGRSSQFDRDKAERGEPQDTQKHFFAKGEGEQGSAVEAQGLAVRANGDRARSFCKEPGNEHCRTIEMTEGGQWMDKQKLYEALDSKQADQRWADLSGKYAEQAKGDVHSFVRTDSAEHRTWASVERPALQNNPDVPRIIHHNEQNGLEITHYENLARSRQEQPEESAAKGPHTRDLGTRPGSEQHPTEDNEKQRHFASSEAKTRDLGERPNRDSGEQKEHSHTQDEQAMPHEVKSHDLGESRGGKEETPPKIGENKATDNIHDGGKETDVTRAQKRTEMKAEMAEKSGLGPKDKRR